MFVAHDLDGDNRGLLRTRRISAVLHHDLRADMRRACRLLLQAGGVLPGSPVTIPSQVQVVTPYNEPAAYCGADEVAPDQSRAARAGSPRWCGRPRPVLRRAGAR